MSLEQGGEVVDLVRSPVPGVGGVPEQGLDRIDFGQDLGADVLHRLEGADDSLELLALLGVLDGDVQPLLGCAEGVGGKGDPGGMDGSPRAVGAAAEALGRSQVDSGERDLGDPAGVVDRLERFDVDAGNGSVKQVQAAP